MQITHPLTKTRYKKLHDALQIGAEKVTDLADYFVLLAQMVNDLYTILPQADILSVR